MHLYAYMEDEMHALALHKQFDSYEETQMLLPLAVLYYKPIQALFILLVEFVVFARKDCV